MPRYVDGFVLTVPKKNLARYRKMAAAAGKLWIGYGALDYIEAVGDDLNNKMCGQFPKLTKKKPNEAVMYSFIIYKSRAHRDAVNKKVMRDPAIHEMCDPGDMPFNVKRMYYGGFKALVDYTARKKRKKK